MSSISKQLGLDYLRSDARRGPTNEGQTSQPASADRFESLLVYGRPIVKELKQSGGVGNLHPILSKLRIPIAVALPVVEMMRSEGMMEIAKEDPTGNFELHLTQKGELLI